MGCRGGLKCEWKKFCLWRMSVQLHFLCEQEGEHWKRKRAWNNRRQRERTSKFALTFWSLTQECVRTVLPGCGFTGDGLNYYSSTVHKYSVQSLRPSYFILPWHKKKGLPCLWLCLWILHMTLLEVSRNLLPAASTCFFNTCCFTVSLHVQSYPAHILF